MQVDEARCYQPARGAENLECAFGGNVDLHRLDHAVANPDIAHAA
jgi:hypothetical protein